MDLEIFESGKKKLRIQKYPDTCGLLIVLKLYLKYMFVYFLARNFLLWWPKDSIIMHHK